MIEDLFLMVVEVWRIFAEGMFGSDVPPLGKVGGAFLLFGLPLWFLWGVARAVKMFSRQMSERIALNQVKRSMGVGDNTVIVLGSNPPAGSAPRRVPTVRYMPHDGDVPNSPAGRREPTDLLECFGLMKREKRSSD